MKDNTRRKLKGCLKTLIESSLEAQKQSRIRLWDGPLGHLDQWCTVAFRGPRRCGHTTMMRDLGCSMFENPAFLTMSEATSISRLLGGPPRKGTEYSLGTFRSCSCGAQHDAMFVDCAFFASGSKMDEIRNQCAAMMAGRETFVLVLLA